MGKLLYLIPLLVSLFEYVAIKSSLAFARSVIEYQPPVMNVLGSIIRIGDNIPYDAVPNMVVTLHLLGLFLSIVFFLYYTVFSVVPEKAETSLLPRE